MIGVSTTSPAYSVAAAELPLSVVAVPPGAEAGAIVVIDGEDGWLDRATAAAARGASALILTDPRLGMHDERAARTLSAQLPVILDRPHFRPDVMDDVLGHSLGAPLGTGASWARWALVIANCQAQRTRLPEVLCDTVGWLRVLAGPLALERARGAGVGVLAQLHGPGGTVSLTARVLAEAGADPRFAVMGIGSRRLQLVIEPGEPALVRWAGEDGEATAGLRFEGRARLAVRRAASALREGERPDDVNEFIADAVIARELAALLPA